MKRKRMKQAIRKTQIPLLLAFIIFASFVHLYSAHVQCEWTGVEKIVAVGDLHGDYDSFIKILKGTGLIDKDLHWTGGKIHLVQIGDIMDRGPKAKEIFDLLMRLEKEAEAAGGKIHVLLGNHEEMNLTGIALDRENYVTVEQFIAFLPESFREKKEIKIKKGIEKRAFKKTFSDVSLDQKLREYWESALKKAIADRKDPVRIEYQKNFNEKYGKWLLEHNAVIKINDIIFVHGGISERFSTWKLEEINNRIRLELNSFMRGSPTNILIVYETDGPLWYRDLSSPQTKEEDLKPEVDKILQNLGARYMVAAHTPRVIKTKDDMKRFDGRIWIIDTGISEVYRSSGGRPAALIIENDYKFSVWPLDFEEKDTHPIEWKAYFQGKIAIISPCLPEAIGCILKSALRRVISFYGG